MIKHTLKLWEGSVEIPGRWIVCSSCEGSGTELRGGLKGAVFTAQDIAEDPEFFSDMMGGALDAPCSCCNGRTTVTAPDVGSCTFGQKRLIVRARIEERLEAESRAERENERRQIYGY